MSNSFKEKIKQGEAKWAESGFKEKGYSYDSSEMNNAKKLARLEKQEALIEAGILDPDEDEAVNIFNDDDDYFKASDSKTPFSGPNNLVAELQNKFSKDTLPLPGM